VFRAVRFPCIALQTSRHMKDAATIPLAFCARGLPNLRRIRWVPCSCRIGRMYCRIVRQPPSMSGGDTYIIALPTPSFVGDDCSYAAVRPTSWNHLAIAPFLSWSRRDVYGSLFWYPYDASPCRLHGSASVFLNCC
jgi:hypothetical protein